MVSNYNGAWRMDWWDFLAQQPEDGGIGPKTLAALNGCEPELFALKYALAKVSRYAEICNRDRTQSKFLLGWINRTLKELT